MFNKACEHFEELKKLGTEAVTGVTNGHQVGTFFDDFSSSIELDYENAYKEAMEELDGNEERVLELLEGFESTTYLYGSWKKDSNGKYEPDTSGEYSAIYDSNNNYIQVVWSKTLKACRPCSPCFPGQGDLDSNGYDVLAYSLPVELMNEHWIIDNIDHIIIPEEKPGDRILLAEKPGDESYLSFVLVRMNKGMCFEYVTWLRNSSGKGDNKDPFYGCGWGHYFYDVKQAYADFLGRRNYNAYV